MPDWMTKVSDTQIDPELPVLLARLLLAWLCGGIVAWLARRQRPVGEPDTLTLTLVLMSILIAMATQIIGDNIARAFSLVGALSIVRFRTAVPETRDVAFVLAAVVVGMAVGAGQYWVSGFGLLVVAFASQFNRSDASRPNDASQMCTQPEWRLTIQVGLSATSGWESEIEQVAESHQLTSAETTRRGGALELVYRIVPRPETSLVDLIAKLNAVPTVESVATKVI